MNHECLRNKTQTENELSEDKELPPKKEISEFGTFFSEPTK